MKMTSLAKTRSSYSPMNDFANETTKYSIETRWGPSINGVNQSRARDFHNKQWLIELRKRPRVDGDKTGDCMADVQGCKRNSTGLNHSTKALSKKDPKRGQIPQKRGLQGCVRPVRTRSRARPSSCGIPGNSKFQIPNSFVFAHFILRSAIEPIKAHKLTTTY